MSLSSRLVILIDRALTWAFIEATGYKLSYCILQIIFYTKLPTSLYIQQAQIFGFIYIGVTLLNRGFDLFLLYLFKNQAFQLSNYTAVKKQFLRHTFFTFVTVLALTPLLILAGNYFAVLKFYYNENVLIWSLLLLFIEITKKNTKVIAYATLYNKTAAWLEIFGISLYTIIIGYKITVSTIVLNDFFKHLAIINGTLIVVLLNYMKNYTTNVQRDRQIQVPHGLLRSIYGLQVWKLLFSTNTLMPLYALSVTTAHMKPLFFISAILQSGEFIFAKICTISGSTFLLYSDKEIDAIQLKSFLKKMIPLYGIIIAFSIFSVFYCISDTYLLLYFTLLYLMTLLCDNLLLLYEKFSIVHNKLKTYLIFYGTFCIGAWFIAALTDIQAIIWTASLFCIGKVFLTRALYNQLFFSTSKHKAAN